MKTYVITLSRHFLANHKRAGEETHFKEKFLLGQGLTDYDTPAIVKIHTIRANYPLWKKRIKEVQDGQAVLSIRQWTGKPYCSKQVEIAKLTTSNGVGVQKLEFIDNNIFFPKVGYVRIFDSLLSFRDGLTLDDWREWFKDYDLSKPMAIIHFTKFRY